MADALAFLHTYYIPKMGTLSRGANKNLQVVYKAKKPDGADYFLVGGLVGCLHR